MLTKTEINKRIGKTKDWGKNTNYFGFDMSKTNGMTKTKIEEIDNHNKKLLSKFKDEIDIKFISKKINCWKGVVFVSFSDNTYHEFSGWGTEDIIYWLIKNEHNIKQKEKNIQLARKLQKRGEKQKKKTFDIARIVSKEKRYQVLKRQKWRCNECSEKLKFNKYSSWGGKIAHIDHIYPYTKRETYPRGKIKINELQNLQALCPKCNKEKYDKIKK